MNDWAKRAYDGALPWPQTAGAHHGLFQASSAKEIKIKTYSKKEKRKEKKDKI